MYISVQFYRTDQLRDLFADRSREWRYSGRKQETAPGEARKLYDALTCERTFMLFTHEEGAEDHCQVASPLLAQQRIFDWLAETFAKL